jgi:hypothetical protein
VRGVCGADPWHGSDHCLVQGRGRRRLFLVRGVGTLDGAVGWTSAAGAPRAGRRGSRGRGWAVQGRVLGAVRRREERGERRGRERDSGGWGGEQGGG